MGIALGEMGMSPEDFWTMRLRDYFLKLRYFLARRQAERAEHAELVRLQTLVLTNIQLARKDRITDPRKFWRFPWEAESPSPEPPAEGDDNEHLQQLLKAL